MTGEDNRYTGSLSCLEQSQTDQCRMNTTDLHVSHLHSSKSSLEPRLSHKLVCALLLHRRILKDTRNDLMSQSTALTNDAIYHSYSTEGAIVTQSRA